VSGCIAQPKIITQVQDLGRCVVAVGAQQDFGFWPMLADLPDQPTNMGRALRALGPACRAQQGPDQPSLAIEDNNGLKAILIVIGVDSGRGQDRIIRP